MSVTVYKALKHRILAGKKIYQNNAWKTIPANAKMWLNGAWHKIGNGGASQSPVVIPTVPDVPEQSLTHENGTEPSTGTIWYITPEGRGNMDGSSWANAASASMIHVILLQVSSGDSVYFAEGDYTTDRTITLPAGVNLFGGFEADAETWSTRNGFTHQTIFTGDNTFGWMDGYAAASGQIVDGFVIKNYKNTIVGGSATLRNSIVTQGTANLPNAYNSVFVVSTPAGVTNATQCNFFGSMTSANASYCSVYYGSSCSVTTSADHVNVYGTDSSPVTTHFLGTAQYCNVYYGAGGSTAIFSKSASYSNAYWCTSNQGIFYFNNDSTSSSFSYCSAKNCTGANIFYLRAASGGISYCTAVDCSSNNGIFFDSIRYSGGFSNCSAINCSFANGNMMNFSSGNQDNATGTIYAINCFSTGNNTCNIFNFTASKNCNCTAVNCDVSGIIFCGRFYRGKAINCRAKTICASFVFNFMSINYTTNNTYLFEGGYYYNCVAVNCTGPAFYTSQTAGAKNCISWNNSGTEFSNYSQAATCAGSTYNAALALTLGNDNSIARFTNTGYYPAQGVQDVGDCPSPIDDPTGYAAYIAAFGDWHPLANSFLIGKGTADSSVTTDADGVTRPDPPTIGAYEPVPVSA